MIRPIAGILAILACLQGPVSALDIVLTNDDGFESAYTHAVYRRLKAAGHRVMISGPAGNQSGKGTSGAFGPIPPLAADSQGGSIRAGAPGIGHLPDDPQVHYVEAPPGMTVIYALDRLAPEQWGKAPDLVISGPNYGYNLAGTSLISGTVAAARFALTRGIPAMAVSDGHRPMTFRGFRELADGDIDFEIAEVVVRLVARLEANGPKRPDPLLPSGVGLNVNIPAFPPGEGGSLRFAFTRLGSQGQLYFTPDISRDTNVLAFGLDLPAVPGFSLAILHNPTKPALPIDTAPDSDSVRNAQGAVTVSVIQALPQAGPREERAVRRRLRGLPLD